MKPLHEKKISELDCIIALHRHWHESEDEESFPEGFLKKHIQAIYNLYREWAIAVVKKGGRGEHYPFEVCQAHNYGNLCEVCAVCKFLIDRFEINQEELK